jgi:putative inorganic carbon (HCO3(-)) transporter
MNSAWAKLALSNLHLDRWRSASYLYGLVGLLANWRSSSWLLQYAEALGAFLICIVLILAPFVSNDVTGILLLAIGIYWGLLTISDEDRTRVTAIHLLVLIYWSIALLSVAFSPVKLAAFADWRNLTLYLMMFALSSRVMRSRRIFSWIVTNYLLVSLLVSGYGVRQKFMGVKQLATWNDPSSPLAGATRVYSYLGNPNLLAGYILPAIALSIAAFIVWQGWMQKSLAATILLVNSACLYFTDSRGSWIGMLALIIVFLFLLYYWWREYLPNFWQQWLLPIILGGLASFLILAFLFVEPFRLRVASIFAFRNDSSNNFRINVWQAVVKMIRDRPLIGIGPGHNSFNKIYPLYMSTRFSALSAYSILLEIMVEMGIAGLCAFLWLLFSTLDRAWRLIVNWKNNRNPLGVWIIGAIAALVGMLTHGFVDTVWYRPEINTLWWLMVGAIASQYLENKEVIPED